ncbi:MAG: CDP-diacylglycerol--glycerol-3-phosphate 3-phosphatidyltransferase [Candidatus Omnitrophica bacterium]|nr:CDP-diacylglycerol--glycerol-3-phosphate 3-phosphatidyltransferase [Candidatus Omnitrophota bacterium]
MNLPNILTILRVLLTFIFMYFLFLPGIFAKLMAIFIFFLASLTDYWDGYLARKNNLVTNFGKLMDPVADKILVLAAFIAFVEMGLMFSWMAMIIVGRELLVTGIRILVMMNGTVIPAMRAGKHKAVSQFFTIITVLLFLFVRELLIGKNLWNSFWEGAFNHTVFWLFFFVTFVTLLSGISFLYHHRFYLSRIINKE